MNQSRHAMIEAGRLFHQRGWVPATGGNFSVRIAPEEVLITRSGVHKGELQDADFLTVTPHGVVLAGEGKPSYETELHLSLYRLDPGIGAVLHVHSLANTVLSMRESAIRLAGYELLKLLPGIKTHDAVVQVPVFENDQDIARLARSIESAFDTVRPAAAYLIAGHGLYTWGANAAEARWRVEALEFMFECELLSRRMTP